MSENGKLSLNEAPEKRGAVSFPHPLPPEERENTPFVATAFAFFGKEYKHMKNKKTLVRTLCQVAMLIALEIVLDRFCSITTPITRIGEVVPGAGTVRSADGKEYSNGKLGYEH